MDILFIQSGHRRFETIVTRQDGVRLSVPVFGPLDPIPHDLAHYVVERELGLQNGFWGSVAAGALFEGMKILAGRQRPHAAERSRAVLAAHRQGIGVAEVLVDAALRAVRGRSLDDAPLPIASPLVRTRADLKTLIARLRPALDSMCSCWLTVPSGGTFAVVWPDRGPRSGRDAPQRAFHHASSGTRP
jgi:hypothetical protein